MSSVCNGVCMVLGLVEMGFSDICCGREDIIGCSSDSGDYIRYIYRIRIVSVGVLGGVYLYNE